MSTLLIPIPVHIKTYGFVRMVLSCATENSLHVERKYPLRMPENFVEKFCIISGESNTTICTFFFELLLMLNISRLGFRRHTFEIHRFL